MRDESRPHIVDEIYEIWGVNSLHDRIFTVINQKFSVGQTFTAGDVMKFVTTNLKPHEVYEAFHWIGYRDSGISVSYHDVITGESWNSVDGLRLLGSMTEDIYKVRAANIVTHFTLDESML